MTVLPLFLPGVFPVPPENFDPGNGKTRWESDWFL